jgi:hypothetical protein
MWLTVEERVFILESYLKTMLKINITHGIEEINEETLSKVARNMVKRVDKCIQMNGHHFNALTVNTG